jgi:hypothetical protein
MAATSRLERFYEVEQQSERERMPEVYIYVAEGRNVEQKRKVSR